METKICNKCKEEKTLDAFLKNKSEGTACKKCRNDKYSPRKKLEKPIDLLNEIWKDIPGYEGLYKASNLGRIKSLERMVYHRICGKKYIHERILSTRISKRGYVTVAILKNGKYNYFLLHRLVALTFIPNPLNLPEVNHIGKYPDGREGNKLDNRAISLEWNTRKENMNHAKENGLLVPTRKGEDSNLSKLTEKEVLEIRNKANTFSGVELSKQYNVSTALISMIINKKIWSHI